jgi:hypothetical protein
MQIFYYVNDYFWDYRPKNGEHQTYVHVLLLRSKAQFYSPKAFLRDMMVPRPRQQQCEGLPYM